MTERVHISQDTIEHLDTINEIAHKHNVSLKELLGPGRQERLMVVRVALCETLRAQGLSFAVIGRVIGRDQTSVRGLLRRQAEVAQEPKAPKHHEMHPNPATRDKSARYFKKMCERGSKGLAEAIFWTGKTHSPMSEADQIEAIQWSNGGVSKLIVTGWMR